MQELKLTWKLEKRKLKDLKDYEKNPRKIDREDVERVKQNLVEFGLIDKPCINVDGTIIGGHQRKKILKDLGYKEIDVWVPERLLTDDEVARLNLKLNLIGGEWDMDSLATHWDADELVSMGFDPKELGLDIEDTLDGKKEDLERKPSKLTIESTDYEQLDKLFETLSTQGWKCKLLKT